jgi:hypothetical protein
VGTIDFRGSSVSHTITAGPYSNGQTVQFIPASTNANIVIKSYPIKSLALVRTDWVDRYKAGEIWNPDFLHVLTSARMGSIRFMDWSFNNTCNVAHWENRMPVDYCCYSGSYYNRDLYAGQTSHSGNDYSITFGSGAPTDKQTIHVMFDATGTVMAHQSASLFTVGNPTVVSWPSHPLSIGDPIIFNGGPNPILPYITYYIGTTGFGANSFQVVTSPGGPNLVTKGSGSGTFTVSRPPTLNLNGTGPVTMTLAWSNPIQSLRKSGR